MRADSRAKILTGAQVAFAAGGYRGTIVADILREAGVARGTFYRYFPGGKFQAFEALVTRFFRALSQTLEDSLRAGGMSGFLQATGGDALTQTFRLYVENHGVLSVAFGEAFALEPRLFAIWDNFDRAVYELVQKALEAAAAEGSIRPVDASLIARVLVTLFYMTSYRDIVVGQRAEIDVESMAAEILRLIRGGLAPQGPEEPSGW
ncbi:MAG: TetR/AcrR family transcriptional regulator [Actinobacteria bacterium]|nr:TetR/AcrR family transcriptional regulator [Actinomycetota bacterium]MBU1943544.1 TetR/AcrR family transcriptional regulator [Actinomycetota bacterium]MBU2687553.1 TetR/AcrR family transcriptional regulator [Actinomycetota bacterium]